MKPKKPKTNMQPHFETHHISGQPVSKKTLDERHVEVRLTELIIALREKDLQEHEKDLHLETAYISSQALLRLARANPAKAPEPEKPTRDYLGIIIFFFGLFGFIAGGFFVPVGYQAPALFLWTVLMAIIATQYPRLSKLIKTDEK